jgi:hypothetical protein
MPFSDAIWFMGKDYKICVYDKGKWAEIISIPKQNDDIYYEYIGENDLNFTKGKHYKINNPNNLEDSFNFIDDKGKDNGHTGENYKYFKLVSNTNNMNDIDKIIQIQEEKFKQQSVPSFIEEAGPVSNLGLINSHIKYDEKIYGINLQYNINK